MRAVLGGIGAWLLVGCAGEAPRREPSAGPCDGRGDSVLYVVRALLFQRPDDGGVCDGFDLDGVSSSAGGSDGCGVADFDGPDGAEGIDNAFAYLLPALELTEAAAVESLIQAAIEDGSLLITIELGGLDAPEATDDACVDLTLGRATGTPLVGTDGRLLADQTLQRDESVPPTEAESLSMSGGRLEAPLDLEIPVTVFDVDIDFALRNGRARLERTDGELRGLFAGGVEVASILDVALEENVDPALHGVLAALLGSWSDLAPGEDGACTQISATFGFEAVRAFWLE